MKHFKILNKEHEFSTGLIILAVSLAIAYLALWLQARQYEQDYVENKINSVFWREVFTNPDFEYPSDVPKEKVIADGLSGWGCCYMEEPPANFGKGMQKIRAILGTCKPEELIKMADQVIQEDKYQI